MKPIYERLWAVEKKVWADYTPQERIDNKLLKPVSVKTMTKATSDCWASETAKFKEDVAADTAAFNEEHKANFELGLRAPLTPLDYHKLVSRFCLLIELTNLSKKYLSDAPRNSLG